MFRFGKIELQRSLLMGLRDSYGQYSKLLISAKGPAAVASEKRVNEKSVTSVTDCNSCASRCEGYESRASNTLTKSIRIHG
jgi:hypothetical protein